MELASYLYFWSDLPKDLLVLIAERLDDDHIEINKFRVVCRSWRFRYLILHCIRSHFPHFTAKFLKCIGIIIIDDSLKLQFTIIIIKIPRLENDGFVESE
ncbi:hypothetical protein ACFE04_023111 [Oxalis oulophora]